MGKSFYLFLIATFFVLLRPNVEAGIYDGLHLPAIYFTTSAGSDKYRKTIGFEYAYVKPIVSFTEDKKLPPPLLGGFIGHYEQTYGKNEARIRLGYDFLFTMDYWFGVGATLFFTTGWSQAQEAIYGFTLRVSSFLPGGLGVFWQKEFVSIESEKKYGLGIIWHLPLH